MIPNRPCVARLVIFDCDGVLVDSERLGNTVLVEAIAELGLTMSVDESLSLFRGTRMSDSLKEIERRIGKPVPPQFAARVRARIATVFRRELKPITGVKDVLDRITIPVCVASSSPPEQLKLSLELTELSSYFGANVFSAYEVGIWKPEPGLFLHAAKAMGAPPVECAVIEDSVPGVQAGVAAGMRVFGYAPAEVDFASLSAAGAHPFRSMNELPDLIGC